ncbi:MAG: hypothetical protein H6753_03460 [Candidatus Omnitrophica bacterium]|nr:hypothetical protein [Candidatus Omnitrophota bacterium]
MSSLRKTILSFLLIWVLASGLGIYLRLYTLQNNVNHDTEEKATILVLNNLRRAINQGIEKANPSLAAAQKQKLAKHQFDLTLRQQSLKVKESIRQAAQQLDEKTPASDKKFYLLASDSYYYYNLTENILNTGKISDKIQGSKYFNPLMNAPNGYWEPLKLYPYVGFSIYKTIALFVPDISLMEAVSYTPLIFTVLILFVFLIGCLILGCSGETSFLGAVYLLCAPIFLRRSMFGWYDDDPPNIFFLFAILTVFFYGLKHHLNRRTVGMCALTCSILFTLYALFWQGWVFLASMIAASAFFIVLYNHFVRREKTTTPQLITYSLLTITGIFLGIVLIFGPKEFFTLFHEGWVALQDFLNPHLSSWPDLYIAVGELLSPTPEKWLEMMGGLFFVGTGILGLFTGGIQLFKKPNHSTNFAIIVLILFALISTKLSLGAQRFETLCLIPFAFAFPLGLQFLWDIIQEFIKKHVSLITESFFGQLLILIIFVSILTILPFQAAQRITPDILNKIFNTTWDNALTKIKNETPPNSIINTWWPPGHFIKAIAQRRVTFDGATINKPQSYWLANAFLTTDERMSAGILRMLNNSGNAATDYLLQQKLPLAQAVDLLKKIVPLNITDAKKILASTLNPTQIDHLLVLTHANPPPSYLLIYQDMAENSLQFSFVGNWDFKKVAQINSDPILKSRVPARNSKDYVPFLWELAGGPPRYSSELMPVLEKDGHIIFENNIQVDFNNLTCLINSPKFGKGIPESIFYKGPQGFTEQKLANANLPYCVMILKNGPNTKCMLAESDLAKSMLLRLFYYQGQGLDIYEPFVDERDTTQRTKILIYKLNWDHFQ